MYLMPSCWAATAISTTGMPTMPNMNSTFCGPRREECRSVPPPPRSAPEAQGKTSRSSPPCNARSPRPPANTSAPAGRPPPYLRFQGLRDNGGAGHLLLTRVPALCEGASRHVPPQSSAPSRGSAASGRRVSSPRERGRNTEAPMAGPPPPTDRWTATNRFKERAGRRG